MANVLLAEEQRFWWSRFDFLQTPLMRWFVCIRLPAKHPLCVRWRSAWSLSESSSLSLWIPPCACVRCIQLIGYLTAADRRLESATLQPALNFWNTKIECREMASFENSKSFQSLWSLSRRTPVLWCWSAVLISRWRVELVDFVLHNTKSKTKFRIFFCSLTRQKAICFSLFGCQTEAIAYWHPIGILLYAFVRQAFAAVQR